MAIPLLEYAPSTQNQRVNGFEVAGEENPPIFTTENLLAPLEIDYVIKAAYRQIFNEQQMLESNRQTGLESQLRNGQITVKDFIRGLLLSDSFRRRNYDVSNNYRFSQMCVQRVLGREVYGDKEKMAWSIVLATKGLQGFVDALLNSDEYLSSFGEETVPYQKRRILPQSATGEQPFARMPRYGAMHRDELQVMGYFSDTSKESYRWEWQQPPYPKSVRLVGKVITIAGAGIVGLGLVAIALAAFEIISL